MNYKAVIFDLDGTLLDTLDDLTDAVNYALSEKSLTLRTKEEIRSFVGNGVGVLISNAIPSVSDENTFDSVLEAFKSYYASHSRDKTKPYAGVCDLIDYLITNDVKLAIVSNKLDFAVKDLNKIYFGDRIKVAIGETPLIKRKPAPDSLLKALDELKVSKEDAVYIGDSEVDIQTAENAGIKCISVSWGFRTEAELIQNGAKTIVANTDELMKMI